ncbi:MAG: hypothetical protein ACOCRZ_07785 [Halothermotrichaceae bacterium]
MWNCRNTRCVFLLILLAIVVNVSIVYAVDNITGDGTAEDPFIIYNFKGLEKIGDKGYPLSAHYKLAADIDASITFDRDYNHTGDKIVPLVGGGNKGWEPIDGFSGTFDGQGYQISELFVNFQNQPEQKYAGLFGRIKDGKIINIGLVDSCIIGWGSKLESKTGGVIGYNDGGTLERVYYTGRVSGVDQVGGLVGHNTGTIRESFMEGNVEIRGEQAGGLVGLNEGVIKESYTRSWLKGGIEVGGLAGCNKNKLINSYTISYVLGEKCVGGLVGLNTESAEITSTYAKVKFQAFDTLQGSIGALNNGKIKQSYSQNLDTKEKSEVKVNESFQNWDFENIWSVDDNIPYLKWEDNLSYNKYLDLLEKDDYTVYTGKIDKEPVTVKLKENNGQITGYYYYDKYKKKIQLQGSIDNRGRIELEEFVNGKKTGQFSGKFKDEYDITGQWKSSTGERKLYFSIRNNKFDVEIEQEGQRVEIVDNEVNLAKKPFTLLLKFHQKPYKMYVNYSFNNYIYNMIQEGYSYDQTFSVDFPVWNTWGTEPVPSGEIHIEQHDEFNWKSSDGNHLLYYDDSTAQTNFHKVTNLLCEKRIEKVKIVSISSDNEVIKSINELSQDTMYVSFIYPYNSLYQAVIDQRYVLKINFE